MTAITPYNYFEAAFTGRSLNATTLPTNIGNMRTITGRLVFNDDKKSAENAKVKFFIKNFCVNHYIGSVKTDAEGRFVLQYHWKNGWLNRSHKLIMGLVEKHLPFKKNGLYINQEVTLEKIEKILSRNAKHIDLGVIPVNYADISRDYSIFKIPTASSMQPLSYFWKLLKALIPELPKKFFIQLFNRWMTIEKVQRIYDSFGPAFEKRLNTPNHLIEELLNHIIGIEPQIYDNQVIWTANWDGLEFDKTKSLPNVKVITNKTSDHSLKLDSIVIKFREDAEETIVKADDKNIAWGIYLARSSLAIKGEAEFHLAEGHILPGIPAKVFFKHIKPENPLFAPLEPHLSQLDFINWFGSRGLIFGTGSVLDASALNAKSILEAVVSSLKSKSDWLNYLPSEPLTPLHYQAKAEALHFNLLHLFFDKYIQKHKNEITQHWSSIFNWSEGIHALIDTLPPITTSQHSPTEVDLKRLAKFCAWLVSKTTFIHWSAHSRQQLLTDLRQCSLAPENKALDRNGNFHPFGNTSIKNGTDQLHLSRVLMNFEGDSIFKDPNGDMDKDLLKLLRDHLKQYEGYDDIIDMHLTTQI